MMILNLLLVPFLLLFVACHAADITKDYCIVGAGPGGLQMGFHLERAGRDYLIFEKNSIPGSFFIRYPRHRKLISINKRNTGKSNKEFNMRHDWNSILSDDDDLLFTKYSKEYFPHPDRLLDYLRDYQQKLNIKVQYNTDIRNVRMTNEDKCKYTMNDQHANTICCGTLIVATGLPVAVQPKFEGAELMDNYDTVTVNPEDYENQRVLIIGGGNSAFELAGSIYGHTAHTHILKRDRVRFSWDTHYVGDLRAVNNEMLDAYMLKSLDGVLELETGILGMKGSNATLRIVRGPNGRLVIRSTGDSKVLDSDSNPFKGGYDRIVACMGFVWDDSMFDSSTKPQCTTRLSHSAKTRTKKYPDINDDFQSTQFPGMYFAGTMIHSLDFRKAAGGFIHGFRYTTRALAKLLEWKNHQVPWPAKKLPIDKLATTFLNRANTGSGIYQMFSYLCDVAIVNNKTKTFDYLEEFPTNLVHELPERTGHKLSEDDHVIVMTLQYGPNFSVAGEDHFGPGRSTHEVEKADKSNFLHPVYWHYKELPSEMEMMKRDRSKKILPDPLHQHHTLEDFSSTFEGKDAHYMPLRKWAEGIFGGKLEDFQPQCDAVEMNCMA
jgi:thioredoxin reductase